MPQIAMANITQSVINDDDVKYWLDEVISTTTVKLVVEETVDYEERWFVKKYFTQYTVYIDCDSQWQIISFYNGSFLNKSEIIAYLMGLCHGKVCR